MGKRSEKRDVWDGITALASILVPAAIALAGHFIAQGLKEAEIRNENSRAEQSYQLAQANTKVAQVTLINTMMKSLTSGSPQERKLAVQAVLIALPEQGPVLARTVEQFDADSTVQAAARSSLKQRANMLIADLFSPDQEVRIGAAHDLVRNWGSDPWVVQSLLSYASRNKDNPNGIYNTAVVLKDFSPQALHPHGKEIRAFIESSKSAGAKTAAKAAELSKKLETSR